MLYQGCIRTGNGHGQGKVWEFYWLRENIQGEGKLRKINWKYNTPDLVPLKAGKTFQVTVTSSMFFLNEEGQLFTKFISLKGMGTQKLLLGEAGGYLFI